MPPTTAEETANVRRVRSAWLGLTESELRILQAELIFDTRVAHRREVAEASSLAGPGMQIIVGDISPKLLSGLTGTIQKRFTYKGKERFRIQLDLSQAAIDWNPTLKRYIAGGTTNCLDIPVGCVGKIVS